MAPLDSARAKLGRAQQHLEVFDAEVREFFGADPYPLTHEFDYSEGVHRWRADLRRPFPEAWPLHVGDCVHNLRSALDHVAWQLAGTDPADRRTQFPIFIDPALFASRGRKQIERIDARPRALIEWLQPYRRANPPDDRLFLIQVFDAEDKHKTIALTGTILDEIEVIPRGPIPIGAELSFDLHGENWPRHGREADAILAEGRAILAGPGNASAHYMDVDIEITFGVAMRADSEGITITMANVALREACERVERILRMFERYL